MAKKDIGEFVRKSEFLSISQNNGILEKKTNKPWNTRESMQPWSSSPVRSEETHNVISNILKLLKTIVCNFPSMSRERHGNVLCGVVENKYYIPRRGEVGSLGVTSAPMSQHQDLRACPEEWSERDFIMHNMLKK